MIGWGSLATVIASWPLIWPAGALVQRNADGYGSTWLIWYTGSESSWLGHLAWVDTLLFGLAAIPAHLLGPVNAYHLLGLIALLLNVLVTEQVAHRIFEIPRPASLIAGIAYGLSPLAGTAIAEGHLGMLLGAGLPLLLGALGSDASKRPWVWALRVVLAGIICAVQSGYFAVLAVILVLGFGGLRRRPLWRIALLAVAPAAVYSQFVIGGPETAGKASSRILGLVSTVATADTLAGNPPGFDLAFYHVRYPLVWALLAFGAVVPVLRRDRTAVPLLACGLVAIGLAMGNRAQVTVFPGEFADLKVGAAWGWIRHWVEPLKLFRFPSRFLWIWYLCGGMLAARSIAWLVPRRAALLGLVVFLELLVQGMRPWEPRTTLAEAPSAYQILTARDTVLDLWPWFPNSLGLHLLNLSCYYQTTHLAQLPFECLTIQPGESPFKGQNTGLLPAILSDDPPRAKAILAGQDVTHVALHVDAFSQSGRRRVRDRLEQWWGPPIATSLDGGETLEIYSVSSGRRRSLTALQTPSGPTVKAPECPAGDMCRNQGTWITATPDPVPLWVLPAMAITGCMALWFAGIRRDAMLAAEKDTEQATITTP
jgi:hypothetical protein